MTLIANRGGAVESSDLILNAMEDKRIISVLNSCVLCALSLYSKTYLLVSPDTEPAKFVACRETGLTRIKAD